MNQNNQGWMISTNHLAASHNNSPLPIRDKLPHGPLVQKPSHPREKGHFQRNPPKFSSVALWKNWNIRHGALRKNEWFQHLERTISEKNYIKKQMVLLFPIAAYKFSIFVLWNWNWLKLTFFLKNHESVDKKIEKTKQQMSIFYFLFLSKQVSLEVQISFRKKNREREKRRKSIVCF